MAELVRITQRARRRRDGAAGAADPGPADRLLRQTIAALGLPSGLSKSQRRRRVAAARATLEGLRPQSTLEGLMAAQTVAIHAAAMACLSHAMRAGIEADGAELTLRRAERLLALCARLTQGLIRARGADRRAEIATNWSVDGVAFQPAPWMHMLTADARAWVLGQLNEAALPAAEAPTT
ncbi:MAG TPA: hypothetical protein VMQ73_16635 [Methylomirabilota bacterium]|nr:hypothetical protein [Methylomirabilota bacterium]